MLTNWFNGLKGELDSLTEEDLRKVGINLSKVKGGAILLGKASDELQRLWTLIEKKTKAVKKLAHDHIAVCEGGGCEECLTFKKECSSATEEINSLRKLFWKLLRKEMKTDEKHISINYEFDAYVLYEEEECLEIGISIIEIPIPRPGIIPSFLDFLRR